MCSWVSGGTADAEKTVKSAPKVGDRFEFFVEGRPRPQPRPRFNRKTGTVYPSTTVKEWKAMVRYTLLKQDFFPAHPIDMPIRLDLVFLMPRPKRLQTKTSPPGRIPYISTPDKDNLDKAVMDSITDTKFWRDDAIVFSGGSDKYYCAKGERPGVHAVVTLCHES